MPPFPHRRLRFAMKSGFYLDRKAVGAVEAKAEGTLSGVEAQSAKYAAGLPDNLPASMQTQATRIANHGNTVGFWSPTTVRVSVAAPVGKVRGGTRGSFRK